MQTMLTDALGLFGERSECRENLKMEDSYKWHGWFVNTSARRL